MEWRTIGEFPDYKISENEYRENGDYAPMKIVRTRVPLEQGAEVVA